MEEKKIRVRVIEKESGEVLFSWDEEMVEAINLNVQAENNEIEKEVLEVVVNKGKDFEW